jgi:hypothetical protein
MAEAVTHRHATSIAEDMSAQQRADHINPGVVRHEPVADLPFCADCRKGM